MSDPSNSPPPVPAGTLGYVDLRALEFAKAQPEDMPASEVVARAVEQGLELEVATVYRVREKERARVRRIIRPKEPSVSETEGSEEKPSESQPAEEAKVAEAAPAEEAKEAGEEAKEAPASAPKRRGRPPKGTETKASFVRAQPASLHAKEVVARAKEKGWELSETYVYAVRGKQAKGKGAPEVKKGGKGKGAPEAKKAEEAPVEKKRARRAKAGAPPPVNPSETKGKPALFSRPPEESARGVEVEFAKLALEIGLVRADQLLVQLKSKLTDMLAF